VYASLFFGIQPRAWRCAEGTSTEVDLTVPEPLFLVESVDLLAVELDAPRRRSDLASKDGIKAVESGD
jgi:hypothetical protein